MGLEQMKFKSLLTIISTFIYVLFKKNGYQVPIKSLSELALAIKKLILSVKESESMGNTEEKKLKK